jgi:hypothetical protein
MNDDELGFFLAEATAFLSERNNKYRHYLPLDRRFRTLTIRGKW